MSTVRIAVVGCGKQGAKHLGALRRMAAVETLAVDADGAAAAALAKQHGSPWSSDVDSVLSDPGVDAVVLCTPTPTHKPLILQALLGGKDFFCEKPLCSNRAEAREIARLTETGERIGAVGYIYRYVPVFERGHEICAAGAAGPLGNPSSALMRIGGRGSHRAWKHLRAAGGGARSEMLVHMVDLALWYFGTVAQADVLVERLLQPVRTIEGEEVQVDAEDYIACRLKMESGVEVLLQADMVTPAFRQFVEVQGEQGSFIGSIQPHMPSYVHSERSIAGYAPGRTALTLPTVDLFEVMMAEFVTALRDRKQPPRCTVEDSLAVLQVLEQLGGRRAAELVA